MNEVNRFNSQNINFKNTSKDTTMQNDKEELFNLYNQCKEEFLDIIEKRVPQNGKFAPVVLALEIAGTNNIAILKVEADNDQAKETRTFSIGVRHENRDRLTSNYMFEGTKQEIQEYLKDKKNDDEIKETILKLSDKTDEYYSTL